MIFQSLGKLICRYLQCSRPFLALFPSHLQCSRILGSPSIVIYSVPAASAPSGEVVARASKVDFLEPWEAHLSLFTVFPAPFIAVSSVFTVFPHPRFPKYRYLQCSRSLDSPSIVIYCVPAASAPSGEVVPRASEVDFSEPSEAHLSLFTVFPPPFIAVSSVFKVFPPPGFPKYRYLQCSRSL